MAENNKLCPHKDYTADVMVEGTGIIYRVVGFDDFRCNYHSIVFYFQGELIAAFSRKLCEVRNLRFIIKDAKLPTIMANYGSNMKKIKLTRTGKIEYTDMEGNEHVGQI